MRIVSLAPSSTEILFALGAGDDVVGVTHDCDYPADVQRRERLGPWLHAKLPAIDALKPDLIITTSVLPPDLRTYAGHGVILHVEPTSLSSVLETMLIIGRALGRNQEADRLVGSMQQQFEDIRRAAPAQRLQVYCEMWPNPPLRAGHWVPELVEIAGGSAVGGVHANPSAPVSVDAIQAADPDLMVFHWCNQDEQFDVERIRKRPGWENVRALQTGGWAYLPDNLLNRPGPRLVEGARQLQDIFKRQHRRL